MADEEEYLIEPLQGGPKGHRGPEESGPHVVYKRSSLRHPHLDTACGVRGTAVCLGLGRGTIPVPQDRGACRRPSTWKVSCVQGAVQTVSRAVGSGQAHLSLPESDGPTVSEKGSRIASQVQ